MELDMWTTNNVFTESKPTFHTFIVSCFMKLKMASIPQKKTFPPRVRRGGFKRVRSKWSNKFIPAKKPLSAIPAEENAFNLKIFTWNVQQKGNPEEIDKSIVNSFKPIDFPDIVCLQEANLPDSGTETTSFKWFCEGKIGLAFLVNKLRFFSDKKIAEIGQFQSACNEIKTLEMVAKQKCVVKIIGCHVPPSTDILSLELWEKLTNMLKAFPVNENYLLIGDFNAQIGKDILKTSHFKGLGAMLYHTVSNENGHQLKDLALSSHMRVLSTNRSPKTDYNNPEKCCTYIHGESTLQQSYILGSHTLTRNVLVYLKKLENYSHALVGCFIRVPLMKPEEDVKPTRPLVSTWNTKGMTPAKVDSILNIYNLPVVCVQEVFLTSEQDILTDNFTWLCSKSMWAKNVGILVKKVPYISVGKFEAVSDTLCVADLLIDDKPLKVISCHLPVKTHAKNAAATAQLSDLLKGIPKDTFYVLAGDFNVKSSFKDSNDGNDTFLQELVKEGNLCMEETLDRHRRMVFMTSVISKSLTGNPNQILIPITFRDLKSPKLFVKWVPFVENGIVGMMANKEDTVETILKIHELSEEVKVTCKLAVIDGVAHNIKTSEFFEPGDVDPVPPLSEELIEKFQNTPPNGEDLGKLLQDFVIFQDFSEDSTSNYSQFHLLLKSFREGKRFGPFTLEADTLNANSDLDNTKRILRIRWNGILLEELKVEEGNFFKAKSKIAASLVRKLHETCYWIKCKKSFFNDGFEPMVKIVPEINDVIREMVKKDFKSEDTILSFIEDFFKMDSDIELVFGPDFQSNFKEILSYAVEKNLKIRFFTRRDKPKDSRDDHIALCKRSTPQEVRDKLLKDGKDVRYILVPPCGLGGDSLKFTEIHLKEILKQENKHTASFWGEGDQRKQKVNQTKEKATIPTQTVKKTPQQQKNPGQQWNQAKKPTTQQQKLNQRRNAPTTQKPLQRNNTQARQRQNQKPQTLQYNRKRKFQNDNRHPVSSRRDRSLFDHNPQPWNVGAEPYKRNASWTSSQELQRSREVDRYDLSTPRVDRQATRRPWENNSYPTNSPWRNGGAPYDRETSYQIGPYSRDDSLYERRVSNNRDQYERELELAEREFNRGGYGLNERPMDYQTDYPSAKRQRVEPANQELPGVVPPPWSSLDPLVLVWPITVESQLEDQAKEILEANFHVEYSQIDRLSVAAFVTLPMRNGIKKSFCLGVGNDQIAAAISALNLIIRHSTIIKPSTSFLCNGTTPNFVRFKVPCQTSPRTYIILSKTETGPLSEQRLVEILKTFKESYNEDVFFDKDSYTLGEKRNIMSVAPQLGLNVRHFGDTYNMLNRYVCVYKVKPQQELLEEVIAAGGHHSKYVVCNDK